MNTTQSELNMTKLSMKKVQDALNDATLDKIKVKRQLEEERRARAMANQKLEGYQKGKCIIASAQNMTLPTQYK
jgi:hypothetical protein